LNSNYAKKSAADMRAAQKETLEQAAAVQKTVAVMEPNWRALIASQEQQVQTLAQILESLSLLATETRIISLMQEQIDVLRECQNDTEESTQQYQKKVAKAAAEAEKLMQTATKAIEERSGKVSEKFSKAISEQQSQMKKWMLRCLLISLIPSTLQIILLLTQLI
jgi:hypothetical protein